MKLAARLGHGERGTQSPPTVRSVLIGIGQALMSRLHTAAEAGAPGQRTGCHSAAPAPARGGGQLAGAAPPLMVAPCPRHTTRAASEAPESASVSSSGAPSSQTPGSTVTVTPASGWRCRSVRTSCCARASVRTAAPALAPPAASEPVSQSTNSCCAPPGAAAAASASRSGGGEPPSSGQRSEGARALPEDADARQEANAPSRSIGAVRSTTPSRPPWS